MKAVVVYEAGGIDNLIYTDVKKPEIRPGWSLINIRGFGVNHSEIFTRRGLSPTVVFPRILGIECVGIIEQTSDPDRLPAGQKVVSIMGEMGRAFDGSYAEFVLVPNEQIFLLKSSLSWETLATLPETYYTAFGSMKNLKIEASDRVLIRGATSGVGVATLNLIKGMDSKVHVSGTTRHAEKHDQLRAIGFDQVVEDRNGELQTDDQYDKILDLIGPATLKSSFLQIRNSGIVCSTGQLGGKWFLENFDPIMDIKANSYLTSFYSGTVDQQKLSEMFDFIEKHNISVKPEKVFSLKAVQEAHRYLESNSSFGKVVVMNEEKSK